MAACESALYCLIYPLLIVQDSSVLASSLRETADHNLLTLGLPQRVHFHLVNGTVGTGCAGRNGVRAPPTSLSRGNLQDTNKVMPIPEKISFVLFC